MMTRGEVPPRYRKAYDRAVTGKASPRTAIRLHCLMCCGWVRSEAEQCTARTCPLFGYRPGTAPSRSAKDLARAGRTQAVGTASRTGERRNGPGKGDFVGESGT